MQKITPFLWFDSNAELPTMLRDKDAGKSGRVMQAMLQMTKLDVAALKQAYEQQ